MLGRTYHRRYGYPWRWAIEAELWWRLEHLPYRGGEGGLVGLIARYAYGKRKAAERRGSPAAVRPRHPAVLLGRLIAKHVLEVQPVDHDAIVSLIKAEPEEEFPAFSSQAQASRGAE